MKTLSAITLSSEDARGIILTAQLLNGLPLNGDHKTALQIIQHLGYIQIDTIAVIKRAHHHTLWARFPAYQEDHLDRLLKQRLIFEYWGHAMAYLPMSDYRFYRMKMKNFLNPKSNWFAHRAKQGAKFYKLVLDRIRAEGQLSSDEFEHEDGKKAGVWWDWKPAKNALEMLFWQGELMVAERKNFRKYYDLTERVLPAEIDTSEPDKKECAGFLVRRAFKCFGIINEKEIIKYLQPGTARDSEMQFADKAAIHQAMREAEETGEIIPVHIEGKKDDGYFISAEAFRKKKKGSAARQIHLLSPFDNLLIQRARTKTLFDFDYMLECYVPEPKRKYGYFVLPILFGNSFAGRLDAKADRASKTFIINSIHFETGFSSCEEIMKPLTEKIKQMAHFNECNTIQLLHTTPKNIFRELKKYLKI
jgi:uncharacterized protein YcaQ